MCQWDFYRVSTGRRQSLNCLYHRGDTVSSLPVDARVSSRPAHSPSIHLSVGLDPALLSDAEQWSTFSQTLDALPASSSWAIQEITLPPDLRPILASLQDGSAHAVSNGSFNDKFGTSAFTIVDAQVCSILGLNLIPCHPDDQGAYCRELAGLFDIVLIVNLICSPGPTFSLEVSNLAATEGDLVQPCYLDDVTRAWSSK